MRWPGQEQEEPQVVGRGEEALCLARKTVLKVPLADLLPQAVRGEGQGGEDPADPVRTPENPGAGARRVWGTRGRAGYPSGA